MNPSTNLKITIMKKIIASLSLFLLFSFASMSQGIYFRAGTGYGLPIATSSIGERLSNSSVSTGTGTTYTNSVKGIKGSYGSGMDFNFALGYKLNENFIIDLNFQYLIGRKYETGNSYSNKSTNFTDLDYDLTTSSVKGFLFNPSVIFSAGFGKAAPYARFGFMLGSPTVTSIMESYYNGDGVDSTVIKGEYVRGFALGFQGAVGMNWKISKKFDLFTEVNFAGLTYYPGELNIIKNIHGSGNFKVDRITNNLPTMNVSQKNTVYKKEYDPTKFNIDSTKPTTASRVSFPLSSLSFQIGIRVPLWNKSE
jgi:hypothetical protein